MPALATVDAFEERLGQDLDAAAALRVTAILDDVSAVIRAETDPVDWIGSDGELDEVPPVVVSITLAVARRAFDNPDSYNQKTVGDVSVSYASRGSAVEGVALLPRQRHAVRRAAGLSAMSTIQLHTGLATTDEEGDAL